MDLLTMDFKSRMAASQLRRRLALAELRCTPVEALLDRLPTILDDPERESVIWRLGEITMTPDECKALAERLTELATVSDALPARDRARLDKILGRLLRFLPSEHALFIARQWLTHPRKVRREGCYKVLRRVDWDEGTAEALFAAYRVRDDREALELLARRPEDIPAERMNEAVELVATHLDDEYWLGRMLACFIGRDSQYVMSLADRYPIAVLRAVVSSERADLLPSLQCLIPDREHDVSFVSWYTWAVGRLGIAAELPVVRRLCQLIIEAADW